MNAQNGCDATLFESIQGVMGKPVTVTPIPTDARLDRPLIAVVSSRLGLDCRVHREACRFLTRSMLDCRSRAGSIMIADGSAIDPWATRAAELFGLPVVRVIVNKPPHESITTDNETRLFVTADEPSTLCRDRVLIAMADRVDAVHVRKGGKIMSALLRRIGSRSDATSRVAVSSPDDKAALELMAQGAIGWMGASTRLPARDVKVERDNDPEPTTDERPDWTATDGEWLLHHTRACPGAWPGETEQQYRDAMLLGDEPSSRRGPFDALRRIVRGRRLVGSAVATDHRFHVVCFSATPLWERLRSRCYRPHLKRWDCEPYGIAIRVDAARKLGAMPVVYGDTDLRDRMSPGDRYRYQPVGKTYDWKQEREWRVLGDVDLSVCRQNDIRVFVPSEAEALAIEPWCPWEIASVAPVLRSDAIIPENTTSDLST